MDFIECMDYEYKVMMALAQSDKIKNVFTKNYQLDNEFSVE